MEGSGNCAPSSAPVLGVPGVVGGAILEVKNEEIVRSILPFV